MSTFIVDDIVFCVCKHWHEAITTTIQSSNLRLIASNSVLLDLSKKMNKLEYASNVSEIVKDGACVYKYVQYFWWRSPKCLFDIY